MHVIGWAYRQVQGVGFRMAFWYFGAYVLLHEAYSNVERGGGPKLSALT